MTPEPPKTRVLLVDAEPEDRASTRAALGGCEVEAFEALEPALARLRASDFHLVVLSGELADLALVSRARDALRAPAAFLLLRPPQPLPQELPGVEMVSSLESPVEPARLVRMVEQLSRLVGIRRQLAASARPGSRATARPTSGATPRVPPRDPDKH